MKFKAFKIDVRPDDYIEMRWYKGLHYIAGYAVPNADWKTLCAIARIMKQDFKIYLEEIN